MPLQPSVYGDLLADKIAKHDVNCWLLNTGWAGGQYGKGQRMSLKLTRSIINRIHDGSLAREKTRKHNMFCLEVPESIAMPEDAWADKGEYQKVARELHELFEKTQHAYGCTTSG
jgi:phosphoenolpyruvate carboxykinase (ATP)